MTFFDFRTALFPALGAKNIVKYLHFFHSAALQPGLGANITKLVRGESLIRKRTDVVDDDEGTPNV